MSHSFRFIAEPTSPTSWKLDAEETLHLAKVLRLDVGSPVEVTDGKGRWAVGTVTSIGSKETIVSCSAAHVDPAPAARLSFAVGALKPGSIDDILPALTELGLDSIHVYHQDESAKNRIAPNAIERWRRILRSSMKQSKRSRIPELHIHASLRDLVKALPPVPAVETVTTGGYARYVLTPGAPLTLAALLAKGQPQDALALAGGEKGLTESELAFLMSAGFHAAGLGAYVLRAVTAAVAAASILSVYREDLSPPR